jgi:tetratricopeptide (TPR) repeat protein
MGDDRLRAHFDVLDVEGTRERLRAALREETTAEGRAEVLTQLARVASWLDRVDEARALLDEADALAGDTGVARARVLLERGRVTRRTDGDAAALGLAAEAYEVALAAGQHFVAADAAHSCALLGDMVSWTTRGLDVADRFDAARYWRGTLLLNLGDWQWERGEREESLATFEAALEARERETRNPQLTEEARFGVARALRALGRPAEAIPLLEQVTRWVEETGFDPPEAETYRRELAAAYADVARG